MTFETPIRNLMICRQVQHSRYSCLPDEQEARSDSCGFCFHAVLIVVITTPEFCRSNPNILFKELAKVWLLGKTDGIANIL